MYDVIIVVLLLVLIVTIILLNKGGANIMGKILGKIVNERHHEAELIVNYRKVPRQWVVRFERRIAEEWNSAAFNARRVELEENAKQHVLKKIDRLIDFFNRSSLFADKESKSLLIERLRSARDEWQKKDWEELLVLSSNNE